MQDNLPDVAPAKAGNESGTALPQKPSFFSRFQSDDKFPVKIILAAVFAGLIILGIAVSVLEKVAPRGGRTTQPEQQFSSGLWTLKPQPNQILFGFYLDANQNNVYDYNEAVFNQISVAIRRKGETEPFRRVPAAVDGWVKIDDLALGGYEVSDDNYSRPVSEETGWLWFDDYQKNKEFLPTAWQPVKLENQGYKELVGITPYRPGLVLVLATAGGVSWYDPVRAREIGRSNQVLDKPVTRGNDLYFLNDAKLKKLDWQNRTETEAITWLEEAKDWVLSPGGQTVGYLSEGEFNWRSLEESCPEGNLLYEGLRLEVKSFSFTGETSWLVVARPDKDQPWRVYKLDCKNTMQLETLSEPVSVGALSGGDWFYSTSEATYLASGGKTVKYTALGGGEVGVSDDRRFLLKKLASGSWLVVDYPAVKSAGVEKHYLLTGILDEPTFFADDVYFVKSKPCAADGDCGEVVRVKLEGSGVWSVADTWDLKDVPAMQVLGVIE